MRTRTNPLAYWPRTYAGRTANLPVVTDQCGICDTAVDLTVVDAYTVTRVRGDSANGYEPIHLTCEAKIVADADAALLAFLGVHPLPARLDVVEGEVIATGTIADEVVDTWAGTLALVKQVNLDLLPVDYSWSPR